MSQPVGQRKKVLVVCHVQPMFEHHFMQQNVDLVERVTNAMRNQEYDQVVILLSTFDSAYQDELYPWWAEMMAENPARIRTDDWDWGYEPDTFLMEEDRKWCFANPHPDDGGDAWVWLPPIFQNLEKWKGTDFDVCGGSTDSCLANLMAAFDVVGFHHNIRFAITYAG